MGDESERYGYDERTFWTNSPDRDSRALKFSELAVSFVNSNLS